MIAISTFRPLDECPEYRENQLRAKASWDVAFSAVVYFGKFEKRLSGARTSFIPRTGLPTAKEMMRFAGGFKTAWPCIVNADIVVAPKFRKVEDELFRRKFKCAFSLRWQKNPQAPTFPERVTDMGLDLFCATPDVWDQTADACPHEFRIGKILWDTWLLQYWAAHFLKDCYDFTPSRCVFHPIHGNRKDQGIEPPNDPYLKKAIWPANIIQV